ncbi:WD40 repeat domain-containing protein [Thermogutta sp.]|uniref:WD40 repeat domain-containing protein n=1 Tax=Thermogutta sp. TaxID=1962930 RepID=UPI0032206326
MARPGTPVPAGYQPITLNNLKQLVPVAQWGEGVATKLVCSPAEPLIALGTTVGVILYEAETLNTVASFSDGWVTNMAFSPDGALLAIGTMDGRVQIWDVHQRKEVRTIEVISDRQINGLAFSPDGRWLASSWGGVIQVWDVSSGEERQAMRYYSTVMSLRFLPPGDRIVAGTFDGGLTIWRVEDGSLVADITQGYTPVVSVEVSQDGNLLVINASEQARLLRGTDFSTVAEHVAYYTVQSVSIDRNGQYIAAANQKHLDVWQVGNTTPLRTSGFPDYVRDPCFGPESDFIALLLNTGEIWVTGIRGEIRGTQQGPGGSINVLTFSPDGQLLGIGTMAGLAQLWQVGTGLPLRLPKIHQGAVWDIAFSPDGQRLLSASQNPMIQTWSTETGEPLESFDRQDIAAYSIAISPDGRYLAIADSIGEIQVLQASDWRRMVYNYRHLGGVLNLTFSPAEPHLLASGGNDSLVWLVDVERRQNIRSLQHHAPVYRVAFSPDGQTLATGLGDGSIYIWRIAEEQPVTAFIAHTATVTGLAFGPDGRFLASASVGEQVVRLWDVSSTRASQMGTLPVAQTILRPIRTLDHPGLVYDLAFSPDGTLLATGLETGLLWLWAVP